jgi:simple sugar transport system ATP-binding protein
LPGIAESPILQTFALTKRFGAVLANDAVDFTLRKGEIHCLLGENGAGKTTLAECLYGYYHPDGGELQYDGKTVTLASPRDAIALGIGMVHQHFILIEPLTVVENIVIGTRSQGMLANLSQAEQKIKELCELYGVELNLKAKIWQLSVGEQQWVEILKALYVGCQTLILDEPTAVLTPQEAERLFGVLRLMKSQGLSIILITHKLGEVMDVSDRVTVLRKGKRIDTVNTRDVTKEDLARMMVGRTVIFRVQRDELEPGKAVLEIKALQAHNDMGQLALHNIDLTLHSREILGIAGVAGNGQRELFEALIGARKVTSGQILLEGQEITNQSPRRIMQQGVAHVPEDRLRMGLIPEFSVAENLILGNHRNQPFNNGLQINNREVQQFAADSIERYEIVTPTATQKTRFLSGGNQQKVILARELYHQPRVLLVHQPTRGLDVGVIEYVHTQLLAKRRDGAAILLLSEELSEIFSLADRIAVMYRGRVMGIFSAAEAQLDEIGCLMAGFEAGAA